ncbi:MAG: hypothetical protein AVDCRST_MAG89-3151 [uncultured Gemmatimonadetes bacterium]|uniref:SpoVT-AbrB domain-containing protein n=1 Tax=uncultured Gemmatimonadota bacterium TaxID=203437 RepID=A0A6J4M6G6_9BACT|nr:MAG: hypothetical protein AVDCRST_MAG89-3151 [uncultured Gemmatimonadota bacterium]
MHEKITLHTVGSSTSAPLPKAMPDRHQIEPGDKVFAVDTDAGILITALDPDVAEAIAISDEITGRFRHALKALAVPA